MPEITSCPACERKLRVPDEYINKMVRCPGCGGMFTAMPVGGAPSVPERPEEDEERRPPRPARSDGFSERRAARTRSERERDEDDRPRRARREKDDYDDRPRRSRRDDDDDYDDRPRRSRRDDDYDDDYDDRPRRRVDPRKGWMGTRTGLHLVMIAGWLQVGMYATLVVGTVVTLMLGVGAFVALMRGGPGQGVNPAAAGGALGMLGGACFFLGLIGLLSFAEFVLRMVGYGMCIQMPAVRESSARGLAIASLSCAGAAMAINLGGGFLGGFGSGMGAQGGMAMAMTGMGNAFGWISNLAILAGFVCWMFFLRSVCLELRNRDLAGRVVTVLITLIGYGFVAGILFVITVFAVGIGIGVAAAKGGPGGGANAEAATAFGGGMIVVFLLGGILFLGHVGLYVWYILTVQQVRDLVARQLNRL